MTLGRWLEPSRLALPPTYHAWPSSYDVEAQRSALAEEDGRHAVGVVVLQRHRGETLNRLKEHVRLTTTLRDSAAVRWNDIILWSSP